MLRIVRVPMVDDVHGRVAFGVICRRLVGAVKRLHRRARVLAGSHQIKNTRRVRTSRGGGVSGHGQQRSTNQVETGNTSHGMACSGQAVSHDAAAPGTQQVVMMMMMRKHVYAGTYDGVSAGTAQHSTAHSDASTGPRQGCIVREERIVSAAETH